MASICDVPDCDRRRNDRRHCQMHQQRVKIHGVVDPYHCVGCGLTLHGGRYRFCGDCKRLYDLLQNRRRREELARSRPEELDRRRKQAREYNRANSLKRTHGITHEQFDAILASQGGGCAICGASQGDARGRRLHVDHDHDCCPGKTSCGNCVRGLLCNGCNTGIGLLGDDPARLASAVRYLINHQELLP